MACPKVGYGFSCLQETLFTNDFKCKLSAGALQSNKENVMKILMIIAALLCSFSANAENSIKEDLKKAQRSPLFQQKFSSAQISAKGLSNIRLHNGVELQFKKYTDLTRLDQNEKFKPLMNIATVNQYLHSRPTYTENILQLEDRLIVERSMKVSMKKGVCQQRNLPISVSELCFVSSNGQVPAETKEYLKNLRVKLKNAKPGTQVKNGMTVRQLKKMNDEQLLDALLNSDDREISLVSVLPTEVYKTQTRTNLWNSKQRLKSSNFNDIQSTAVLTNSQFSTLPTSTNQIKPKNQVFPKKYFLTGFTLGREITDTFEIELASSTWLTDRYYVRFEYEFSAGFGLRFPFSVSVESQASNNFEQTQVFEGKVMKNAPLTITKTDPRKTTQVPSRRGTAPGVTTTQSAELNNRNVRDHRQTAVDPAQVVAGENTTTTSGKPVTHADIKISVAPVNVGSNGSPAYPAVNLPQNKYFDGKEFVLKFHAGCSFKASIPGKDINESCPSIDIDKSRDINPVIGDERARLATLWLNGNVTGLAIEVWAGRASLDFGIESNLTNGRIRFNANGYNNTLIANHSRHSFLFEDKNTQQFKVVNNSKNNAAFYLDSPSYGFDFELRPVARARFSLDLGIKTLNKTLGPYSLDALSLSIGGFSMKRHEGTVNSHIYSL